MPVVDETKGAGELALMCHLPDAFPALPAAACSKGAVAGVLSEEAFDETDVKVGDDEPGREYMDEGVPGREDDVCFVPESAVASPASPPPHAVLREVAHERGSVVLFDWDDTMLPSSFLASAGVRLDSDSVSEELAAELRQLERSVCTVLQTALQTVGVGRVSIVTNAEHGWVQLSCQKFLPGVLPLLDYIPVVSARSTFERFFPDRPVQWKANAMRDRIDEGFRGVQGQKHVISFGDSQVERQAVMAVTRGQPGTTTKSVKFTERPTIEQLRRQLELVCNCFHYIHGHDEDLDLVLTINPSGAPSPRQMSA